MTLLQSGPVSIAPQRKWYFSTWVLVALLILTAVLFNWPSHFVYETNFSEGKYGPDFGGWDEHLERGWPFAFMSQNSYVEGPFSGMGAPAVSLWSPKGEVRSFNAFALIADCAFWFVLTLTSVTGYQLWRSNRHSIWQLNLRDCAVLFAIFGVAVAWFTREFRTAKSEQQIVAELQELAKDPMAEIRPAPDMGLDVERIPSGPDWLRQIAGDRWFAWRDKISGIHVPEGGLKSASRLSAVRRLSLNFTSIKQPELTYLAAMRTLRAIDARWLHFEPSEPDLPDAEGVYDDERTYQVGLRRFCQSLASLPELEALDLNESYLDDAGLTHLGRIASLRLLAIIETNVTDAGLRHIVNLKKLERLNCVQTKITDQGLSHLSGLTELRELWISNNAIRGSGLRHLVNLKKLEVISLPEDIDPSEVQRLRNALPNLTVY